MQSSLIIAHWASHVPHSSADWSSCMRSGKFYRMQRKMQTSGRRVKGVKGRGIERMRTSRGSLSPVNGLHVRQRVNHRIQLTITQRLDASLGILLVLANEKLRSAWVEQHWPNVQCAITINDTRPPISTTASSGGQSLSTVNDGAYFSHNVFGISLLPCNIIRIRLR